MVDLCGPLLLYLSLWTQLNHIYGFPSGMMAYWSDSSLVFPSILKWKCISWFASPRGAVVGRSLSVVNILITSLQEPERYFAAPILQTFARDICDFKVPNTRERCHGAEHPDNRGRCPDLPGARKRYLGNEILGRRPHLEAKVEATWPPCKRGGTQTICATLLDRRM